MPSATPHPPSAGVARHPIAAARTVAMPLDTYLRNAGGPPMNARFDKRTWGLSHTRIYTSDGKPYELLNGEVHGHGGYGKVRPARNCETGEIVAAKKIYPYRGQLTMPPQCDAQEEFDNRELIGDGPYFLKMYGVAHTHYPNGRARPEQCDRKSYLFMEAVLRNGVACTGLMRAREIHAACRWSPASPGASIEMRDTAYQYLAAIAWLHRMGVYYPDAKLGNFLHDDAGRVKLCDYGLLNGDINHRGISGTYNPPEFPWHNRRYTADKHDSYCLGIALFQLVHCAYRLPSAITVQGKERGNGWAHRSWVTGDVKNGFAGTDRLPGNTIEEVAAKLMDADREKRLSPAQALELPYFTSQPVSEHIPRYVPGEAGAP